MCTFSNKINIGGTYISEEGKEDNVDEFDKDQMELHCSCDPKRDKVRLFLLGHWTLSESILVTDRSRYVSHCYKNNNCAVSNNSMKNMSPIETLDIRVLLKKESVCISELTG